MEEGMGIPSCEPRDVGEESEFNSVDEDISFLCTLDDLFVQVEKGEIPSFDTLKREDYAVPRLFKLMRDIVSHVAHLHSERIVHGNLKPKNVLIFSGTSLFAKVSEDTAAGSSIYTCQTYEDDLYALGCVLFFCISRGQYLLCTSCGKHPYGDDISFDSSIQKKISYRYGVHTTPEALDIIFQLVDISPNKRPRAAQVLDHPFFWDAEKRLDFLRDASSIVDNVTGETRIALLKSLRNVTGTALGNKCFDIDPNYVTGALGHILRDNYERYERYPAVQVFKLVRYDLYEKKLRKSTPWLFIVVYIVMLNHASQLDKDFVNDYLRFGKWGCHGTQDLHMLNGINDNDEVVENKTNSLDEDNPSNPCSCNLREFFMQDWNGKMPRIEFLYNKFPKPPFLELMRNLVSRVAQLHREGIVHGDLKPQNVVINSEGFPCAIVFTEPIIGTAESGGKTYADDLFDVGCLLYFCISFGKDLFCTSCGKYPFGEDAIVCDAHMPKTIPYFYRKDIIPEAEDLISRLIDPTPERRPSAVEVLDHPLFWDTMKRLEFFYDASSIVDNVVGKTRIALLKSLQSVTNAALGEEPYATGEPFFEYPFDFDGEHIDDSGKLGFFMRRIHHGYIILQNFGKLIGPAEFESLDRHGRYESPRQLIEVYKVMSKHSSQLDENFVAKWSLGWIKCDVSVDRWNGGSLIQVIKSVAIFGCGLLVLACGKESR